MLNEGERIRQMQQNVRTMMEECDPEKKEELEKENEVKKVKYEKKVEMIIEKILKKVKKYIHLQKAGNEAECKSAYVVFQSMEGRTRFLRAYNYNDYEQSCCCRGCFGDKNYKKKLFEGRFLQVDPAPEPSIILWENLGINEIQRNFRIFGNTIISLIFVAAAIIAIVYAKNLEKKNKYTTCPKQIEKK